jgi:hypothetical protein
MTNTNHIPNGSLVRLPDGTEARAYRDPRDGTYATVQPFNGVQRRDEGWRRDFLEVLA